MSFVCNWKVDRIRDDPSNRRAFCFVVVSIALFADSLSFGRHIAIVLYSVIIFDANENRFYPSSSPFGRVSFIPFAHFGCDAFGYSPLPWCIVVHWSRVCMCCWAFLLVDSPNKMALASFCHLNCKSKFKCAAWILNIDTAFYAIGFFLRIVDRGAKKIDLFLDEIWSRYFVLFQFLSMPKPNDLSAA